MIKELLTSAIISASPATDNEDLATADEVKDYIEEIGIRYPEIVYYQFVQESGRGTSRLAREANNLFGMKKHMRKESLAIGYTKSGFAVYRSWKDSIVDYLIWQLKYTAKIKSKKDYLKYLRSIYSNNEKKYLYEYLGY